MSKGKEGRICWMDSFQNGAISRTVLLFSVPAHSAPFRDLRLMPLTPGNRPHSFCIPHSHLPPLHVLSPPRMPSRDCLSCGALALVVTTGITWCPSGCDSTPLHPSCLCIPSSHQGLAHHRAQEMLPAQERTRGTPLQHSTLGKLNHSPSLPRQPSPVSSPQGYSSLGGLCSWR